jgi:hypothetical protein
MLMVDVENAVMNCQMCVDEGQVRNTFFQCFRGPSLFFSQDELITVTYTQSLYACQEDAFTQFGILIYSLDRLHKAVRKPATKSGEWTRSDHLFL